MEKDDLITYMTSDKFKESFKKAVEKDTWAKGFPKIYMLDGWIVEHWSDGRINQIKKVH